MSSTRLDIYRKVWTAKRAEKLEAYRRAGDQAGVVRLQFGAYVKSQRLECGLSQEAAGTKLRELRILEGANKARKTQRPKRVRKHNQEELNREREQWNEWEQGVHLPEDINIRCIAEVLDGDPAAFLRHAKRPVPSYLLVHDVAWATRTFRTALREARSFVELANTVQEIWQRYAFEQTRLRGHIKVDPAYSEVLEMVQLFLDEKQQVQLARYIVRDRSDRQLEKYVEDALEFRQEIQNRLRTLATTPLSPALHNALEDLGIVAGRCDGLTTEMEAVLRKIGLRELEPIADPYLLIYELSQHYEVINRLLPELTTIDQAVAEAVTKVNSAFNAALARRYEARELVFQLSEMVAKLERRVATITNPRQKIFGELGDALEHQRKRKRKRFTSSDNGGGSSGQDES